VPEELRFRVISCWREKLALTLALNLFFWVPYSLLSRHEVFPARAIPLTWFDAAVGFSPDPWGWIYLSQFLYTGTIPWLIAPRADIRKYVVGLSLMCGTSFLIFLFFPVRAPRPEPFGPGSALSFIAQYDGGLNAFPSLHAAFMIYTFALGWRLFGGRLPRWLIVGAVLWGVLILYATLATKQHFAWDLIAGALLGYLSDRFAWRGAHCRTAPSTILSIRESTSHAGDK
jgi:membrane-associated phospholipid phosphatase